MTEPCTAPDEAPHAWARSTWVWHLVLPVLLAFGVSSAVADPATSTRRALVGAVVSLAMVAWYAVLRPDRARDRGEGRRSLLWGLGSVLLWLPLVLVHPAFFLVLTGLFTTIFAMLELRPASWLAGLLGLEIAVANLRFADPSAGEVLFTLAWAAAMVAAAIAFAHWIHAIIEQSADRHELIARLEATRAELVAVERAAGVHDERARLTGEIHDTLAQSFTSLVLLLQAVEADLAPAHPARARVALAVATARDGLVDARRLMADLDPEPLDARSLPDAIERVAARFDEETGVRTEVVVEGERRKLAPPVEVALLRATQESLANVRKHARASRVRIGLRFGDDVALRVDDDGAGFDPADPTDGYGLRGMRDRLATVDGRVEVDSAPGAGTHVLVEVP